MSILMPEHGSRAQAPSVKGGSGSGVTNVSCQLKFWPFVSCQLNFGPFVSCQ